LMPNKSSYTIQLSPNCKIEEEFEDTKGSNQNP
jgi:hypothetical protein